MLLHQKDQHDWAGQWNAFLRGETEAFETLHNAFYPDLYRYAMKLRQNKDLAEDAIQELFVKLWLKRRSLPRVKYVKAYLIKALRRIILNELRNLDLRNLGIDPGHEAEIVYSGEDILVRAEQQQLQTERVAAILNTLSKRQREVIYLRYYQELDYGEIASVLGINYQSALNLSQRALTTIRKNFLPRGE